MDQWASLQQSHFSEIDDFDLSFIWARENLFCKKKGLYNFMKREINMELKILQPKAKFIFDESFQYGKFIFVAHQSIQTCICHSQLNGRFYVKIGYSIF